jgi:DNA polymerase-3 subunit beta
MFEVGIKDFTKAVAIANAARDRRSTIPVLEAIRVQANGRLELSTTNLDMSAHVTLPCETSKEATFLLSDVNSLVSSINAAGGAKALFAETEGGFSVKAGQLTRITDSRMKVEDFPATATGVDHEDFTATLSAEALQQIERVAAAISREETRYYLNGIHMKRLADDPSGWTYRFAATDGHRLMVVDVPLPDAQGELPGELIIPRQFLTALFHHFRRAEGPVTLKAGRPRLANTPEKSTAPERAALPRLAVSAKLGTADVTFTGKVIDGTYPDYSRVIPKGGERQALFSIADLRRAVLAVSAGMNPAPAVRFLFKPGHVVLGLEYGVEGVSAAYRLDCQHNMPDGFYCGFKGTYVLDQLAALRGTDVRLAMEDAAAPSLWQDVSDPAFISVLMPMLVNEPRPAPKGRKG